MSMESTIYPKSLPTQEKGKAGSYDYHNDANFLEVSLNEIDWEFCEKLADWSDQIEKIIKDGETGIKAEDTSPLELNGKNFSTLLGLLKARENYSCDMTFKTDPDSNEKFSEANNFRRISISIGGGTMLVASVVGKGWIYNENGRPDNISYSELANALDDIGENILERLPNGHPKKMNKCSGGQLAAHAILLLFKGKLDKLLHEYFGGKDLDQLQF
jgi:hypothetical protein